LFSAAQQPKILYQIAIVIRTVIMILTLTEKREYRSDPVLQLLRVRMMTTILK
jgi:hypothetical protein